MTDFCGPRLRRAWLSISVSVCSCRCGGQDKEGLEPPVVFVLSQDRVGGLPMGVTLGFLIAWLPWGGWLLKEQLRALAWIFQLTGWHGLGSHTASILFPSSAYKYVTSLPVLRIEGGAQGPWGALALGDNVGVVLGEYKLPQLPKSRLQEQAWPRRLPTSWRNGNVPCSICTWKLKISSQEGLGTRSQNTKGENNLYSAFFFSLLLPCFIL